ncbi:hypothetical protein ACVC7V_24585 [Hydrogenophaga sp. A37]|uniref:hypothetical protein n=1 Tax=Hydrogenophaga sp. A37 TaxID=1945864 RepID=UPI0009866F38|nr:hypothetical protein [Hydrogenophaga sp. A37]OOG88613.1 hypothetical protein B0E41_01890 [Hydrogenophaga sp. A37]
METDDRSYLNKIDAQTLIALQGLSPDENPVVSAAVEWKQTPTSTELQWIADAGGQWQSPAGLAPTSIQTLRLPVRAIEGVARMPSVLSISAGQPMGSSGAGEMPPTARPDGQP